MSSRRIPLDVSKSGCVRDTVVAMRDDAPYVAEVFDGRAMVDLSGTTATVEAEFADGTATSIPCDTSDGTATFFLDEETIGARSAIVAYVSISDGDRKYSTERFRIVAHGGQPRR